MTRLAVYFAGFLASGILMLILNPSGGAFAIAGGFLAGFAIPLIEALLSNARYLRLAWYSARYSRTRIRISASYLFQIKIDNQYLLIKGTRFDQFQPVGGVYKTNPSAQEFRTSISMLNDDLLVPDAISERDLRVRIPGRKLLTFIRWFEGGHGRETDGWREFYEELIATGILGEQNFKYISYDTIRRYYQPLRYSEWAKSQELIFADILSLLPTAQQETELRLLAASPDSKYVWATEDQIRRRGVTAGASNHPITIAETAEWIV